MAFINNIKKIFGLSGEDDFLDLEDNVPASSPNQIKMYDAPQIQTSEGYVEMPSATVDAIFAKVVAVFNASLPGFIGESINADKQRQYLYNQLDTSIKEYLTSLDEQAMGKCQAQWDAERQKLQKEAEDLRTKTKDLENRRALIKDQQLSAERQKRALQERVRDLESQMEVLEAEKEQLTIENKSMVMKTKAMAVLEADMQSMKDRMASSGNGAESALIEEVRNLKEENNRLKEDLKVAKVRSEINDAMKSDFKRQAAQSDKDQKDISHVVDNLRDQLSLRDAQIDDLHKIIEEKDAEIHSNEVAEHELEEIKQQLTLFGEVKDKMQDHINRLKRDVKEKESEIKSLKDTIRENLEAQAKQEEELRSMMADMKKEIENKQSSAEQDSIEMDRLPSPNPRYSSKKNKHKKKNKYQPKQDFGGSDSVDDLANSTDWLVSTPPEGTSMRSHAESDDFGYQPPQPKARIENDSQLSLFDL